MAEDDEDAPFLCDIGGAATAGTAGDNGALGCAVGVPGVLSSTLVDMDDSLDTCMLARALAACAPITSIIVPMAGPPANDSSIGAVGAGPPSSIDAAIAVRDRSLRLPL